MFPTVAGPFLKNRKADAYYAVVEAEEAEKQRIEDEKKAAYKAIPAEEKEAMMLRGLYSMGGDSTQATGEITQPEQKESKLDIKTKEMLTAQKPKSRLVG